MKYLILILITIVLNNFLEAQHHIRWEEKYEKCKAKLILENNFKNTEQAYNCVNGQLDIKILGTLLFKDGSIL